MTARDDEIFGHERTTLVDVLTLFEQHGSDVAQKALLAFIGLRGVYGPGARAFSDLVTCANIAKIMDVAQRLNDARWRYKHKLDDQHEYVVCTGPGERTELTADEARWNLLHMLKLPIGSTRIDFIKALDAARKYDVPS
jgi:hypothetical protein